MIVGIIIIALMNPSFISCFFVLLSSNLIYFATFSPKTRLKWGAIMLYFNFFILIAVAIFKVMYLNSKESELVSNKAIKQLSYESHKKY
jgi:hypothetical protein